MSNDPAVRGGLRSASEEKGNGGETVRITLEITYKIDGELSLLDAMTAAKEVIALANQRGAAIGEVVMGRRRFDLR